MNTFFIFSSQTGVYNKGLVVFQHAEAVVEEGGGLGETGTHGAAVEEYEEERAAVAGGGRGEAVAGLTGEARLDADAAVVGGEQGVGVEAVHVAAVGQRHLLLLGADDGGKGAVAHGVAGQTDEVAGRAVVVGGGHAVGIGVVGAGHAEVGSFFVHHVAEGERVAADVLGHGVGGIVVALEHHLGDEVA